MRKVSHSEITTYLDCQKKWELQYQKGLKIDNADFRFGSMGHKVLETGVIPDELLYPELKEAFEITSWQDYFNPIIKEINEYFKDYQVLYREYPIENDMIKGVIDVIFQNKNTKKYVIADYKFSRNVKGQEDILLDEQMYIYAVLLANEWHISLNDIEICYVSIPKKQLDKPRILKSGELSKDASQNITYDSYVNKIKELGLKLEDYEDFLSKISGRKLVNIAISPINVDMAIRIMQNIDNTIKDMDKGYVLEKCTFMCKHCDYLDYCKYGKEIKNNEN